MKESNPLVSVIIPNYNHAPYLKQRIESVLNQTYDNFEVIILDDCSTDNSVEIINGYKNEHIKQVVLNDTNSGNTFLQWEKGFSLASGELIWIAESDDYADMKLLEKAVEGFNQYPQIVLTFFHSEFVDENCNVLNWTWEKELVKETTLYDGIRYVEEYLSFLNSLYNASMIVFKKNTINYISSLYKTLPHCGDWAFWIDVAMQGDILEIPQKLNYFRQHTNKVSNKASATGAKYLEDAAVLDYLLQKLNLTKYQIKCLCGRMTKRLKKCPDDIKQTIISKYSTIFKGGFSYIMAYEIDTIFNFSKLYFKKHKP